MLDIMFIYMFCIVCVNVRYGRDPPHAVTLVSSSRGAITCKGFTLLMSTLAVLRNGFGAVPKLVVSRKP